jgi:hypothetical protein
MNVQNLCSTRLKQCIKFFSRFKIVAVQQMQKIYIDEQHAYSYIQHMFVHVSMQDDVSMRVAVI